MPVTEVVKDHAALTLTLTSEWDAPVSQVWQVWSDPRKLERWWGPPSFPATVTEHDLRPGGKVAYYMTGPEGDQYHGWWSVLAVEEASRLEVEDGFADRDGNPDTSMPTMYFTATFTELAGGRTRMVVETRFPSREAMEQLETMGMEEGMTTAMAQIDGILAQVGA